MRLRLLGPVEIDEGQALGPRDRVVVSALAVRRGDAVSAEVLADALWPQGPPASWAKVVQGCVSRLRRRLGAESIETSAAGYRLTREVLLDRDEFERLVTRGREQLDVDHPERAVALLDEALTLWRGPPFADLEEWLPGRLEAARLAELRLTVQEELLRARLGCGEHREVATEGTVLVGEEPWRERRWEILALAQYRSGRQAEALATIRAARRALGRELGLDPGSGLVDLERAILGQDPSLAADHEARVTSARCPWRGLASYDADDRDTFFGRDADVSAGLARLREVPLLALVGPSGSGKSSLMKAGLAPQLREQGRQVVTFTPGRDPVAAMATARASTSGDPVLCVDQFEEVFTSGLEAHEVVAWLRELSTYAAQGALVVLTVRSDFVSELTRERTFAGLVEGGLQLVAPLSTTGLREIIEGPAASAGLRLEHGLVDLLLRDAEDQPGALPLLSHALSETWHRRDRSLLTVEGYRTSGGISGAVATSADRLLASLSPGGRGQLRWLMLRMGSLADHGEPVRTPVSRQVVTDSPERARVVDLLIRARLVTSADAGFELAHESLVRAWPQLRTWLEEDRTGQRLWRHLAAAAAEWERLGRPHTELYQGVRLDAAREWAAQADSQPTALERAFLEASAEHSESERRSLEEQAQRHRGLNRRLRGLLASAAILLVLALVATLLALDRGRTAADERDGARQARALAQHESLVGRSLTLRSTNRAAAAVLAVEAHRSRPGALSESALLGTFTEAPGFLGYGAAPYPVVQGDTVPGTGRAILASGSRMHVLDLATGEVGPAFDHPVRENQNQNVVKVSADGTRVAQLLFDPDRVDDCGFYDTLVEQDDGRGCTLLVVFDVATGDLVYGPEPTPFSGGDVAIDSSGSTVAVTGGFDGDLATYDVDQGRLLGTLRGLPRPEDVYNWRDTGAVVFGADDTSVYLGSMNGPVREVGTRTLTVRRTLPAPEMSTHNYLFRTRDGRLVGAGDRGIVTLEESTGRRRWFADLNEDPDAFPCTSFTVAEAMGRAYCGSAFGEIEERDLRTGQLTGVRLDPQLGEVGDLAVAHGNELVAFSRGYYRWRLDGSGLVSRLVAPGRMSTTGYDDSGRYLAISPRERWEDYAVLDLETGRSEPLEEGEADVVWVGGRTLMVLRESGSRLLDVGNGRSTRPTVPGLRHPDHVIAGRDAEHAWFVAPQQDDEPWAIEEFEVGTGRPTGVRMELPGWPYRVRVAPDGSSAWVNYFGDGGSHLNWEDETRLHGGVFEFPTGDPGPSELMAVSDAFWRGDRMRAVGSDLLGVIREYDVTTMAPVATLPGSRGALQDLTFSDDGRRLLSSSQDGTVQVYDSQRWLRIGAIPSLAPTEVTQGFLRPDGKAVLVNGRLGVTEWTLEPDELVAAACAVAGRNLTRSEWATYLGDEPYRRTCPQYPAGE